ncbi:hypothetical protein ACR8TE_003569 [Salmonella enterica]|nr:hypothetical protein [Salmonella enterica subsp. enterica serovar Napoli]HBC0332207.1 hypothetical protein [Salmonella enterica subsp. enterica serovar Napoli]
MSLLLAAGGLWAWMGYTTAQIHHHTGSLTRYQHSVLRQGAVWLFIFICWPLALSLYEAHLANWCKWRPYGKR